jgi:4-amino-4-deoxy-L-arabinose transferase-like glycosyltransferase
LNLLLPIISGIGVLLVYILARRVFDEKVALYSAILLTFLPLYNFYSGKVLTDVYASVLITSSVVCFWLGFEKGDKRFKIGTGVVVALAILARYVSIILPIAFLIYLIIKNRNINFLKDKYIWIAILAFLLTLSPLFYYGYKTYGNVLGPFIHGQKATSYWGGNQPWSFYFSNFIRMFSLIWIFFVLGLYSIFTKKNTAILLLLIWFFSFLIFATALPHKEDRFLLPLVSPLVIISALAIKNLKYGDVIMVFLILISLTVTASWLINTYNGQNQEEVGCFFKAIDFMKNLDKNSLVFTDSSPLVYYYTHLENHFYTDQYSEVKDLIRTYYENRTIYMLWSKYDNPRDSRNELNNDTEFETVFKCPNDGSLALIYKHL